MKGRVDYFLNVSSRGSALIATLILVSIIAFALETEFPDSDVLRVTGTLIAAIFGVEYMLRVWSASVRDGGRLGYIFSFYGIIDLLAFLPALLVPAAGGGVLFRLMRLLRLMQLLKIKSVRRGIGHVINALQESKGDLIVSFAFSIFLIFVGAVGMYFVEGRVQPEVFGSIPRSLWWSVATLTTVGYGDVYPVTAFGKVLASFIALIGIAAVAMPAGILAAAFSKTTRTPE